MASDLPDCRNGGPLDMAKRLVTYLDSPRAIRKAIRSEFDYGVPDTRTIIKLRAAYLKQPITEDPLPCDAWKPIEQSDNARVASGLFLTAIERERELSATRHAQALAAHASALRSPLLTRPEFVDRRFDKEYERAWAGNTEL